VALPLLLLALPKLKEGGADWKEYRVIPSLLSILRPFSPPYVTNWEMLVNALKITLDVMQENFDHFDDSRGRNT
jgi:hypothetical protein